MVDEEKKSSQRGKSLGSRKTQWKPGETGNIKGRGEGVRNRATIIREVLNERVSANIKGERKKITVAEAFTRKLVIKALEGDPKAMRDAMALWEETETKLESAHENAYAFNDTDREVIKALYDRMKACEEPT